MLGNQQVNLACSGGLRGSYSLYAFLGAFAVTLRSIVGADHGFVRMLYVARVNNAVHHSVFRW